MKKIVIISLLMFVSILNAASFYSIASGNWSDGSIWSDMSGGSAINSSPKKGDDIFIENGFVIIIDASAPDLTKNPGISLTISGGGSLTASASQGILIATNGTFDIANGSVDIESVNVKNGSTISIGALSTVETTDFFTNGDVMTLDGTLTVGGVLDNDGTITGIGTVTAATYIGTGTIFTESPTELIAPGTTVTKDGPLPVTLSTFTASLVNTVPQLQWTTQSEQENLGWNVYRSPSLSLGQGILLTPNMINGAGTLSEPTDYIFYDRMGIEGGQMYAYWIESISYAGDVEFFGPVTVTIPYGLEHYGTPVAPKNYGLQQNHPNPFNPSTTISFSVENTTQCNVSIYDSKGREIAILFNDIAIAEQSYHVVWNGKDKQNKQISSGIYFYRLMTSEKIEMRKMILIK